MKARLWTLLEFLILCAILYFLAAIGESQTRTVPVHFYPVGWQGSPAPFDQAGALGICGQIKTDWAELSSGVINVTCQAEAPHVFAEAFPGPCEGTYGLPLRDKWIILYGPPNCRFYQTNLGTAGGWWQVVGKPVSDHEVGHTLGLMHTCEQIGINSRTFDPNPTTCCNEYAGAFDVMGRGWGLTAFHKNALGVPNPGLISSTTAGGFLFFFEGPIKNGQNADSVAITYAGGQQTNGCDNALAAFLAPGQSWTWAEGGITVLATSARTVSVTRFTPAATFTPTPFLSPTPTPTGGSGPICRFGFTEVTCTPTPASATYTPTAPSSSSTPVPTTAPTTVPSIAMTVTAPPSVTARVTATVTPDATRHPTAIPPRPPSPPSSRGCGGSMGLLVGTALAFAAALAGRKP